MRDIQNPVKQLGNNLGSKHSLLMKFGQFISYYERNKIYHKIYQNQNHHQL